MSFIEISFLGVGLAMDAVAVSMANGMAYKDSDMKTYVAMPVLFGLFQGIMPFIGYYAGSAFAEIITKYSGYVIFLILGVIGGNMIREGVYHHEEKSSGKKLTVWILIMQAVATSIDAFAVGVGFCAVRVEIIPAVSLIAFITFLMVIGAILTGKKFGDVFENKAEILGGIILIAIGVKAFLQVFI